MTLKQEDLDGIWRVSTIADYTSASPMESDGETEIIGGETHRIDKKGCQWHSIFTVLNNAEVKFESTADPSEADPDFGLTNERGEITRDPVTYTTILKVARKGDKIRLSGQIEYGSTTTVITMMKI